VHNEEKGRLDERKIFNAEHAAMRVYMACQLKQNIAMLF